MFECSPEDISGILITHEHSDHTRCISALNRKAVNASVYSAQGTLDSIASRNSTLVPEEETEIVSSGEIFTIGDIEVIPFALSHDAAEPLGYLLSSGDRRIAIMTDTGVVTESARAALKESDVIVIEANHEENMLMFGRYPFTLKRRILSENGHLSNIAAAACLSDVLGERSNPNPPIIKLAHLSEENNTPDLAFLTIKNALFEEGYIEGIHYNLGVLSGDEISDIIRV